MITKRKLLDFANSLIQPWGVQLCREGIDMKSVLITLSRQGSEVRTVIDLGASTGRWSEMAMPLFPNARFIGVDPLKEREPALDRLKQRRPNFDYVLCAAGEKPNGTVELAVGDDLDGSTVGGSKGAMRTIPSHSVDAITEMKRCEGPFLLKFDTHGFEVPILNGATKVLSETAYIIMEVYNYRHTDGTLLFYEMCQLLGSLGFRCFNMADPLQRPLDRSLWQMDFFFARKDDVFFNEDTFRKN
jgi:FkbM family methyltransferase